MPSKKVSALAAAALLFATSTAVAQTAPRSLSNFAMSAALLQGGDVDNEMNDGGMAPVYAGALIALVALGVIILVASDGGSDETVSPN